jgi:ribonuclease HII
MSSKTFPSLELEHSLIQVGRRYIIGIDEVGRGAIAGPVAVGAALLDSQSRTYTLPWPAALADSKLMTEKARVSTAPQIADWVAGSAIGYSSSKEIDQNGIVWALASAAGRALNSLLSDATLRSSLANDGAIILLDGSHNWLGDFTAGIPVTVRPKADRDCVSVACASVLAKVARDELMVKLADSQPGYLFEGHKGYASAVHIEAIRRLGPSAEHRMTWLTKILNSDANSSSSVGID